MNDIVHSLSISIELTLCGFLHWAGLQAPGGTLALLSIYNSEKLLTHPTRPGLSELQAGGSPSPPLQLPQCTV